MSRTITFVYLPASESYLADCCILPRFGTDEINNPVQAMRQDAHTRFLQCSKYCEGQIGNPKCFLNCRMSKDIYSASIGEFRITLVANAAGFALIKQRDPPISNAHAIVAASPSSRVISC